MKFAEQERSSGALFGATESENSKPAFVNPIFINFTT